MNLQKNCAFFFELGNCRAYDRVILVNLQKVSFLVFQFPLYMHFFNAIFRVRVCWFQKYKKYIYISIYGEKNA